MKKRFFEVLRILLVIIIFTSSFFLFANTSPKADELSDLNNEIQQKQKQKEETLNKIKEIEKNISSINGVKGDLTKRLTDLKAQKTDLEKQVSNLEKQISDQESTLKDYSEKLKQKESDIEEKTNYLYKLSYSSPDMILMEERKIKDFFTDLARTNATIDFFKGEVKEYKLQIDSVNALKEQIEKDKKTIVDARNNIDTSIKNTQNEIAKNNKALADQSKSRATLTSKLDELNSQLKFMGAKQQQLLQAELAKMNASNQTNQKPLEPGQYYFLGRGRDLIEGHGLGMSQWGAYGMAQKGWTFDKILTFYYSGVTIGDYQEPETIVVDGKTDGPIPFEDYLAGIGEVPNSWPPEVIKAQVVAARTYAMRAAQKGADGHYHICGTASCQVYVGGTGKLDYVRATKGKVILYNGQPIVAYYSASHRGHSSSLNVVWGSSDLPYIKPVRDDDYAYKDYASRNPYNPSQMIKTYNWQWRTNGYSLDQISEIFSKSNSMNVGKLKNINISRDVSNRVSRITLIGDKGTKTLTGWDFRAIFNTNTPYSDYVYSTEFGFYQQQ